MSTEKKDKNTKIKPEDRFATTSDAERRDILKQKNAKNTNKSTKFHIKLLRDFLIVTYGWCIEEIPTDELPEALDNFYLNIQTQEKNLYIVQSLKCIRVSLNHYFKSERGIDLIKDPRFIATNDKFDAVKVKSKKAGKVYENPTNESLKMIWYLGDNISYKTASDQSTHENPNNVFFSTSSSSPADEAEKTFML